MTATVAATLVQLILGFLAIGGAFAVGWVMRGEKERQRHNRAVARRRAVAGAREVPARPGTKPARVSRAQLNRGREMQ